MEILYDDEHIIVVEKPGGLLSVPGRGAHKQDSVASRVRTLYPHIPHQPAVHRLDLHTSGIMVLAKTPVAHRNLAIQFQNRKPEKRYIAHLDGIVSGNRGRIELRFRLDVTNRPYQIYDPVNGRLGVTLWRKIGVTRGVSRIEFSPLTGRTHQLRLHSAHELGLHTPIIGDYLYGTGKDGDPMLLHAAFLSIYHPDNGKKLCFASTPPF